MRIIDKNTDFYDFYQNIYVDKTLTFDRRDSFVLTKELMCDGLSYLGWHKDWDFKKGRKVGNPYVFIILQICNNFWRFKVELTKLENDKVLEYELTLIEAWRDFDKPRALCKIEVIDKYYNGWKAVRTFDKHLVWYGDGHKEEKHIPLLKASGLAEFLDAHEVYLAFEEYFSLEKTESERREPIGTTDIDKIESHGFDKKTSFRGKV